LPSATVCTSASIQFYKSRTARSDKNTNSCHKTCNKTATGYIFYQTSKILQTNKKTRKINLFNAIPKTFKDVKFTVDGCVFQTFITLSTKNFCLLLAVHIGLKSLSLWLLVLVVVGLLSAKKSPKLTFTIPKTIL